MKTRIQQYNGGTIYKVAQQYEFVKNGNVLGTYANVQELVSAHPEPSTEVKSEPKKTVKKSTTKSIDK